MSYDNLKFGIILSDMFSQNEIKPEAVEETTGLTRLLENAYYDIVWVGSQQVIETDPQNIPLSFITANITRNKKVVFGLLLTASKNLNLQVEVIQNLLERYGHQLRFCVLIKSHSNLSDTRNLIEQLLVHLETDKILVGSDTSPIAATIAGYYGLGLFTGAATSPGGENALAPIWEVYSRYLKKSGHPPSRKNWSIAGPMHIANATKKSIKEFKGGSSESPYISNDNDSLSVDISLTESSIDLLHTVTIGSPKAAIKRLKSLQQSSGGFGTFLFHHHRWVTDSAMLESYNLIANKVMKRFQK